MTPRTPPVYVGFWIRFVAFLIDSTVASIVVAPLAVLMLGDINYADVDFSNEAEVMGLLNYLVARLSVDLPLMGALVIGFWLYRSATPGKMIFKAVIVDANTGDKPTPLQLIVRYLGYFVALLPLGFGLLWVSFDSRKQGWHDKLARTVVVRQVPAVEEQPIES